MRGLAALSFSVAMAALAFAHGGVPASATAREPGGGADGRATPTVRIAPSRVEIGATYSGAVVRVTGEVATGSGVVVVIRGAAVEETLNTKGRFGPIWINTGRIHVGRVPSVFLSFTSAPIDALLTRNAVDGEQLDLTAVEQQAAIVPASDATPRIRREYLVLKTGDGLYASRDRAVTLAPAPGGLARFTLAVRLKRDEIYPNKRPGDGPTNRSGRQSKESGRSVSGGPAHAGRLGSAPRRF